MGNEAGDSRHAEQDRRPGPGLVGGVKNSVDRFSSHTGGKPKVGDVWMFALCRYDYSIDFERPDLSTTAPLTREDYHQTDNITAG